MKLYHFQIPAHIQGGRLYPLARRMLPEVPEYALREAFQKRDAKLNGQRVGMDALAVPGAEVRIYTRDFETKMPKIPIHYEDDNVLAVFKPAGVSCEADAKGGRTLPQLLHAQMMAEGSKAAEPLLCHRLDNPTEGLLLLAKTAQVQQLLQDAFRNHQIRKEYTCVVRGTPSPLHCVLEDWLLKDAKRSRVQVSAHQHPGAKKIITEYTVMQKGECARLLIRLHTGRTHQIRAHMAFAGHPVLGDDQYGDRAFNRENKARRLMLCSTALSFALEGELSYLNSRCFTCKPTF